MTWNGGRLYASNLNQTQRKIDNHDVSIDNEGFVKLKFSDALRTEIEEKTRGYLTQHPKCTLEGLKKPNVVPQAPAELVDFLSEKIPEIIRVVGRISDYDHLTFYLENAPIAAPFGQNQDARFRAERKGEDRLPVAEYFLLALCKAANLQPDIYPHDNDAQAFTYPTALGDQNTATQEQGSERPFDAHVDSSFVSKPSRVFALACGQGNENAQTTYLSTALLMWDIKKKPEMFSMLSRNLFRHRSGLSTAGEPIWLQAPVIERDHETNRLRFRGNFAEGRLEVSGHEIRDGKSIELSDEDKTKARNVLSGLQKMLSDEKYRQTLTLKPGDLVIASNRFHMRHSYVDDPDPRSRRFLTRLGASPTTQHTR